MKITPIIGLEVHVELNTNSKIFSPAPAHFGAGPNENTNIVDWSFPGVLPVMNKGVIESGIKAALALNMDIHQNMHFDRKNYFYPDNPKAYQISQFDEPIGYNGSIEIELEDGTKKTLRIERAHLEEDAGKNTHGTDGYSYVDLNRQGVPLIEIVSEADMRSPEEAYAYLTAIKEIILTIAEMEGDFGTTSGFFDDLDGIVALTGRLPFHRLRSIQSGATRNNRHLVGNDKGRIKADAKLPDQVRVLGLITGQRRKELFGP